MNLIGKILVMLNFIAAISFMVMALMVHATHTNWRDRVKNQTASQDKPLGLETQLQNAQTLRQQLQDEKNRIELALNQEIQEREQRQAQLEAARAQLETERNALQQQADQLSQSQREAVAQMEAASKRQEAIQTELNAMRENTDRVQKERDMQLDRVAQLEAELAEIKFEWQLNKSRNQQLLSQIRDLRLVLQDHQIPLQLDTPRVNGLILASDDNGMVEISIGSDDGLARGQRLEVFRTGSTPETSKYLGRIEIVRTETDKAVGRIIPEFQKGKIQRGDRVATRLS